MSLRILRAVRPWMALPLESKAKTLQDEIAEQRKQHHQQRDMQQIGVQADVAENDIGAAGDLQNDEHKQINGRPEHIGTRMPRLPELHQKDGHDDGEADRYQTMKKHQSDIAGKAGEPQAIAQRPTLARRGRTVKRHIRSNVNGGKHIDPRPSDKLAEAAAELLISECQAIWGRLLVRSVLKQEYGQESDADLSEETESQMQRKDAWRVYKHHRKSSQNGLDDNEAKGD